MGLHLEALDKFLNTSGVRANSGAKRTALLCLGHAWFNGDHLVDMYLHHLLQNKAHWMDKVVTSPAPVR
eukprot:CAMPEP_0172610236 /NCGR_PEP_ID=MMETSP1068-20121228/30081_1 /TAXON_ID=35684 /ORGANISM="Pseudopedinella elastica, Strain CCMP716" /LENGTH=68 /DNA_ID=CAMNT_0013413905 /DNA_START=1 /DNA_END=204 /DNA_ORIENTATION=+